MKRFKIIRWAVVFLTATILISSFISPSHSFAQTTNGTAVTGGDKVQCDWDGDPLTWVLCPVYNGISSLTKAFITAFLVPLLKIPPVNTDPASPSFQAWTNFRAYGDIFLVIAIIVIVFGQAIGGGVVDAYTAKKVLPRILVSAILINLSIYIVALLVDLGNIAGQGITDLILAPFNNTLSFTFNAGQGVTIFSYGFLGAMLASGTIAGTIIAIFTNFGTVFMAAIFAILPFLFAIIAVFFTLILRQGIILLLVIISPVAFALYVLPNTEKMFRRWWDLLLEAILVYPIVMTVFATADVLSGTIMKANGATNDPTKVRDWAVTQPIAAVIALALQVAPLFLIPFAFRIAGGTLARGHDIFTKGAAGISNGLKTRQEFAKRDYNVLKDRGQQDRYRQLKNAGSNAKTRPGRWFYNAAAGRIGGYNIEQKVAGNQEMMNKEINDITSAGPDEEVRALTVNKRALRLAQRGGVNALMRDAHMQGQEGRLWRTDENGQIQLADAAGKWQKLGDARRADERWGTNVQALQSSLSYTMRKATREDEVNHMVTTYDDLANSWNMTDGEATGVWTGAAFSNQNENLQYKYYSYKGTTPTQRGHLEMDGRGLMSEVDEKRGNWAMAQQNADTWTTMSGEVMRARKVLAQPAMFSQQERDLANETIGRATRIANNYIAQSASGQPIAYSDDGTPITNSGAPARVQEEAQNFVKLVIPRPQTANPYAPQQVVPRSHPSREGDPGGDPRYN